MRRLLTALAILASLVVPASAQIVWPSGGSGSGGGAATSIDAGGAMLSQTARTGKFSSRAVGMSVSSHSGLASRQRWV